MNKYVIIGSGIAGLSAAAAIREADLTAVINMFTRERNLPYSRPMLTKAPFISFNPDDWTIYSEDWFEENDIRLHHTAVQSIDAKKMTVTDGDKVYFYDKLILAMGAESFVPPIAGSDKEGIFTIRRSEDILNIKKAFKSNTRIVVIGGGVIGLEAAVELARYGASVTVLEALPYLMTKQIDKEVSDIICSKLNNIEIHADVSIASINGNQSATGVTLADGRHFECDFIVMACGVKADLSIVPQTVETARAIVIDENCRTSDENIYAAGDCAQYNGINYALWSQGIAQGRVAGINAAGGNAVLETFDTSLVMNSPELSLFALGDMGKNPDLEYEVKYVNSSDSSKGFYVNPTNGEFFEKQYYVGDTLVGAAIVGNLSHMQELKDAINGKEAAK